MKFRFWVCLAGPLSGFLFFSGCVRRQYRDGGILSAPIKNYETWEGKVIVDPPLPGRKFKWLIFLKYRPESTYDIFLFLNEYKVARISDSYQKRDKPTSFAYYLVVRGHYQLFWKSGERITEKVLPGGALFLYSKTERGELLSAYKESVFLKASTRPLAIREFQRQYPSPFWSGMLESGEEVKEEPKEGTIRIRVIISSPPNNRSR